jgi:hypothetical protein
MSYCLVTGSQRVLLRDVSVFTTALPWKRCGAMRHGPVFNLPRPETARSKHRFPYCCLTCLQTSVSLRLLHGVNTSQYTCRNGIVGLIVFYAVRVVSKENTQFFTELLVTLCFFFNFPLYLQSVQ